MITELLFTTLALSSTQGTSDRAVPTPETPDSAGAPSAFHWADYDADGLVDAFAATGYGGVLLHNLGDGSFRDATREAGLAGLTSVRSASFLDVDASGSPDLFVAGGDGSARLFLNDGHGLFADASVASGLPLAGVRGSVWRDYDGDRLPDLSLATVFGEQLFHNLGGGRFEPARGGVTAFVPSGVAGSVAGEVAASVPNGVADLGASEVEPPDQEASSGPGATSTAGGPPTAASVICADSVTDVATGNCVEASSNPTLGSLYPLGPEFSIDGAGRVGIGTTTPGAKLHVLGGDIRVNGKLVSTTAAGPPLQVSSGVLVNNLNADRLDGFDASDFSQLGAQIETAEIALGAVNSLRIANGTILDADVNAAAAIQGTKIVPDFGTQDVETQGTGQFRGLAGEAALRGESAGLNGPTRGFVGIQGTADFDGITTLDWDGFEIGVGGVSTGSGAADNYGVLGQSNGVGVRGSHSDAPGANYGELGTDGFGVIGRGDDAGGKFGAGASLDGVRGITTDFVGYGVWGRSPWRGVFGQATDPSGYGVYSSGDFAATGTKAFINPHPSDPLKEIRFVCLEGNESGTYFRGSAELEGGIASIDVPEEFRLVTSTGEGLTVQVTVVGAPAAVWIESKSLDEIVVRGSSDVSFDYFVNGVRRGFETHEAIVENRSFVPTEEGVPFGAQYPESLRRILVENGTLNADYTPNAATTSLMRDRLPEFGRQAEER